MKKIVALLLSVLILTSLTVPAFAEAGAEAADQGFAYYRGEGVAQDYGNALELFLKADQAGNTQVQFTIGEMFEFGYGVERDLITAVKWYMKAAQLGDAQASVKLKTEPLRSYSEAMSVQKQATHVPALYGEEENIRGYISPLYPRFPIIRVRDITIVLTIEEWLSGWPYGNWYLYVKDPDGNWHHTSIFKLDKTMGEGIPRVFHLDLDQEETAVAIALAPADKGMDFAVRFDVEIFASEENVGEYSAKFPEPKFTPARSDHPVSHVSFNPPAASGSGPSMIPGLQDLIGNVWADDFPWADNGIGDWGKGDYGDNYPDKNVCFSAETMIHTADGLVPIEEIKEGDLVWSWNDDLEKAELHPVVETYVNPSRELAHLTVHGETISCTPAHRFYVPQKGWTQASELQPGDTLVLLNGEAVVLEGIRYESLVNTIAVYNFQVQDTHNYYVGQSGIMAHNAGTTGGVC